MLSRRKFLGLCSSTSLLGLAGCSAQSLPLRPETSGMAVRDLPFAGLITSLHREYDYLAEVEGVLPAALKGTLYRNGVGLLDRNGMRKRALMDGDGMVHSYTFHGQGVRFRNRFVQTEKFRDESRAGTYLYPTFSTQAPGGALANIWAGERIKSQAQISVVLWNERLYAFDESSLPYELDPARLETVGVSSLGLPKNSVVFSGHSKIDMRRKEWVLFGLHFGRYVTLHITVIGQTGLVISHRTVRLPRYVYIHDFLITERNIIFILHPLQLSVMDFLLGIRSMSDALTWRPEKGNLILVVTRTGNEPPRYLETDPVFHWHTLNAHESDGAIVADFVGYDEPDHFLGPNAPVFAVMRGEQGSFSSPGLLRRYTIDLKTARIRQEVLLKGNYEWPVIHPWHRGYPQRYGYLAASAPGEFFWSRITRYDYLRGSAETFDFGKGCYCGEPLFVPHPGKDHPAQSTEEAGWVLSEVYQSATNSSFLAVFSADRLESGPIAKVNLLHHLPYSMHGFWHPQT